MKRNSVFRQVVSSCFVLLVFGFLLPGQEELTYQVPPEEIVHLVERIKQPFSHLVPYRYFPQSVEVWEINGNPVKTRADIPLAESTPRGFDAVRPGPRSFGWRTDVPAVLHWVEARDEGNPGKKTDTRDKLFFLDAPFTGKAVPGPALKYRFRGVQWGTGKVAMINGATVLSRAKRSRRRGPAGYAAQ